MVYDVVAEAESRYNIIATVDNRSIMGYSMGGFGAMQVALNHPDVFGAVASHNSYLYFDDFLVHELPLLIGEQDGPQPWVWDLDVGLWTRFWFLLAGAYSPNQGNLPHHVDFPMDGNGDLIPETWLRWKEHDPAVLAEALAPSTAPAIYFDCGTNDEFKFHAFNVSFDAHLANLGIEHEWQSYVGNHSNSLDERFPISLNFLDDAMNAIPNQELVTLRVFDISGRMVRKLISAEPHTPGRHEVNWNGRDDAGGKAASGTYFYRLDAGEFSETKRMALIK